MFSLESLVLVMVVLAGSTSKSRNSQGTVANRNVAAITFLSAEDSMSYVDGLSIGPVTSLPLDSRHPSATPFLVLISINMDQNDETSQVPTANEETINGNIDDLERSPESSREDVTPTGLHSIPAG